MAEFRQIALLIDADNTQPQKMEAVVEALAPRGRLAVRRAFGNWSKDALKSWIGITKRLSIKAEQQFDYVADKNATDMALAIAALDLLHRGNYDAFAIVSSDSDFTPLAIYLRECGAHVIGFGKELTPIAFRNSCDEFICMETLEPLTEALPQPQPRAHEQQDNTPAATETPEIPSLATLHRALQAIAETRADAKGYVACGEAGNYLQKIFPGFKIKRCGFSKLTSFLAAYPDLYQLRWEGKGSTTTLSYRCLATEEDDELPPPAETEPRPEEEQPEAEISLLAEPLTEAEDEAEPPTPAHPRKPRARKAPKPEPEALTLTPDLSANEVHDCLRAAANTHADELGFVQLSRAGMFIRKFHPDFMVKLSGYRSLSQLIKSCPELYLLREKKVNGVTVFSYRCR